MMIPVRRAMVAVVAGALGLVLTVGDGGVTSVAAQTATAPAASTTACPALPQNMRPRFTPPAHAAGTVGTITGPTFTVVGKNNSTSTVTTDANTRYETLVNANVGAIAVGDLIMAQGTTPSAGTFAATSIVDNGKPPQRMGAPNGTAAPGTRSPVGPRMLPPGCMPKRPDSNSNTSNDTNAGMNRNAGTHAFGIVQSISGTTITIGFSRGGKTITVTTDANTKVTVRQQGSFADLHPGDQVVAVAARNSGAASNAASFTAAMVSDQTAH